MMETAGWLLAASIVERKLGLSSMSTIMYEWRSEGKQRRNATREWAKVALIQDCSFVQIIKITEPAWNHQYKPALSSDTCPVSQGAIPKSCQKILSFAQFASRIAICIPKTARTEIFQKVRTVTQWTGWSNTELRHLLGIATQPISTILGYGCAVHRTHFIWALKQQLWKMKSQQPHLLEMRVNGYSVIHLAGSCEVGLSLPPGKFGDQKGSQGDHRWPYTDLTIWKFNPLICTS